MRHRLQKAPYLHFTTLSSFEHLFSVLLPSLIPSFHHLLLTPFLPLSVFYLPKYLTKREREMEEESGAERERETQREVINHPPLSEFGFCCCSSPSK